MKFGNEKQKEEYSSIVKITQRLYEQMGMVIIRFRDSWWAPMSVKFNVIITSEAANFFIS